MLRCPAVAALLCLATFSSTGGAESSSRRFTDEEVLQSQRPFSQAWRKRFNSGDAAYCGGQYVEDASMLVRLGPASSVAKSYAQLEPISTLHGRIEITQFWTKAIGTLGLKELCNEYAGNVVHGDKGVYAPNDIALDDDTVVSAGKLAFGGSASGLYTQTWVRKGGIWQFRSDMLVIEQADTAQLEAAARQKSPSATAALRGAGDVAGATAGKEGSTPIDAEAAADRAAKKEAEERLPETQRPENLLVAQQQAAKAQAVLEAASMVKQQQNNDLVEKREEESKEVEKEKEKKSAGVRPSEWSRRRHETRRREERS